MEAEEQRKKHRRIIAFRAANELNAGLRSVQMPTAGTPVLAIEPALWPASLLVLDRLGAE
jgi:hypothetical protein